MGIFIRVIPVMIFIDIVKRRMGIEHIDTHKPGSGMVLFHEFEGFFRAVCCLVKFQGSIRTIGFVRTFIFAKFIEIFLFYKDTPIL
jgi:hypothetical protein